MLTTHGHFDHIQAVTQMRDAGIEVGVAAEDAKMLPSYDFTIPDDDVIEVGSLRLRTIHTPGHTPGRRASDSWAPGRVQRRHVVPRRRRQHQVRRRDFPQIIESIDRRLFTLPGETLVLPGHGLDTTIGAEQPHLDEWVDRGW